MTTRSIPSIKRCTKCGFECPRENAAEFFHKQASSKGGLKSQCKQCSTQYTVDYYKLHSNERRAYRKMYYDAHADSQRAYSRQHYALNKDKGRKVSLEYYYSHREQKRAYNLIYKSAYAQSAHGKNVRLAAHHRRRARKACLPNVFTQSDWEICLNYWHGRCAYCGKQAEGLWATVNREHFIPLTSPDCPGTVRWNMLPACEHCNLSKRAAPPREWIIHEFGKYKGAQILRRIDEYFEQVRDI